MEKLISIIIPMYNSEKSIIRCLKSVLNQTYKNIEIILINDGSSDDCSRICEEYSKMHENVIAVSKGNGGVSTARNMGISISHGDYLCFIDSDDCLDVNFLSIMKPHLNNEIDIVACCCTAETENKQIINHFFDGNQIYGPSFESKVDLFYQLLDTKYGQPQRETFTGIGVPWGKLYRNSLLKNVKFDVDLKHLEDNIFNQVLFIKAKGVYYLDKPLYYYSTNHIKNVLMKYDIDVIKSYILASIKRYKTFEKYGYLNDKSLKDYLDRSTNDLLTIVFFTMLVNNSGFNKQELICILHSLDSRFHISELIGYIGKVENYKFRIFYYLLKKRRFDIVAVFLIMYRIKSGVKYER